MNADDKRFNDILNERIALPRIVAVASNYRAGPSRLGPVPADSRAKRASTTLAVSGLNRGRAV